MVEAIVVISVFILFFVGMVYFQSLYQKKLRVQELARAAAVAYAMGACSGGNPLAAVQQDLGGARDRGSGNQSGGAGQVNTQNQATIGNQGNAPVGNALANQGLIGDPMAAIGIQAKAAGTTKNGPTSPRTGFRAKVASNSYVSCGDVQKDGDVRGVLGFVESAFLH